MIGQIHEQIATTLKSAGVTGEIAFSKPPKPEMGDVAFGCFALAKEQGKNPAEVATEIADKVGGQLSDIESVSHVSTAGPYVNFTLDPQWLASAVLTQVQDGYGSHESGKGRKVMVEFAHPNTHKAFHIGHLRNIITGESVVRMLRNGGYDVVPVNYQGDVGMHIAKCLWGISQLSEEFTQAKKGDTEERVAFLGKAYAQGGQAFEATDEAKKEIIAMNDKLYSKDVDIIDVYQETRQWSLDYLDEIYEKVGTTFERLYFESEVYERGIEIVQEYLEKGVFKVSDGATIFEGSKYDLHDRVFLNSKGFPTYEAKEMALGELQFSEHNPDQIIHVVGKEQAGYFDVVFKALEYILPESKGKEEHLSYGWVTLKNGKMSSRTGNVVLGMDLLDQTQARIKEVMSAERDIDEQTSEKIAIAAVKYGFLKGQVKQDIAFDMETSIATSGDSGPYLLYIVARIKSIISKLETLNSKLEVVSTDIHSAEKQLLLQLAEYPAITAQALETYDPSKIAQYLFGVAKAFNVFYDQCPVVKADEQTRAFRLQLIRAVEQVMTHGLYLLGITPVDHM